MGKTSIFSSNYEKMRRKRKKRIVIFVVFVILIALFVVFSGNVREWANKNINIKSSLNIFKKKDKSEKEQNKEQSKSQTKTPVQEEMGYPVTLSGGTQIKLMYENVNNDKKFKYVAPEASGIVYSINPSGKNIVVLDDKNQNLTSYDIDGKATDITKTEYVSRNEDGSVKDTFLKDTILASKANYIWHNSPKFIDNENIAYISQLPWFNNDAIKYVWTVNIINKGHNYISALSGENISFGEIDPKGLTVKVNDKTYFLSGNGQINQ